MTDTHRRAAPDSAYIGSESVALAKLDTVAAEFLRPQVVPLAPRQIRGFSR
jgi:hypothetical protein